MNLEQAIGNQLNYYKRQRNIIKAHHTKASLISLRKDWLDRQTKPIIRANMTEYVVS